MDPCATRQHRFVDLVDGIADEVFRGGAVEPAELTKNEVLKPVREPAREEVCNERAGIANTGGFFSPPEGVTLLVVTSRVVTLLVVLRLIFEPEIVKGVLLVCQGSLLPFVPLL